MIAMKSQSRKFASVHAIERAIERYGIIPNFENICANILYNRNAVRLCTTGDRIRYACFDGNEWFLVVYSDETGMIVTVLPLDALFHHEKLILRNSPVYRQVGDDSFGILDSKSMKPFFLGKTDKEWGVRLNFCWTA